MPLEINVNVFHHFVNVDKDDEILVLLRDLKKSQKEMFMAVSADLKALSKKIDDATNAVAERIEKLSASIKNSMTDTEVAEVQNGLQSIVDRLTVLGADPADPVPADPVPVEPPV